MKVLKIEYWRMTNKIYCEICESAYFTTTEVIQQPLYRCTMCQEHIDKHESHRVLQEQNYDHKLVIDCGND